MEKARFIHLAVETLELLGVLAIISGPVVALIFSLAKARQGRRWFICTRRILGHHILLGLELLVAADIIRTVTVHPSMGGVLVLGLIVLIRTFLSYTIEIELNGRLPWNLKSNT